jgi:hypothetical protein
LNLSIVYLTLKGIQLTCLHLFGRD